MSLLAQGHRLLATLLIAFAVTLAVPAQAQQRDASYDNLVAAINASVDQKVGFDNSMAAIRRVYAADPSFAGLEEESPGFLDDLMAELRPVLQDRSDRLTVIMDDRLADLFARNMSVQETKELVEFFRSDAVRTFNRRVSRAYSPEALLVESDLDEAVTAGQIQADASNATTQALLASSKEERDELEREAASLSGMAIFKKIRPQATAIRAEIENLPTTPEEDAALDAAMMRAFEKHFP